MKKTVLYLCIALTLLLCVFAGCVRHGDPNDADSNNTNQNNTDPNKIPERPQDTDLEFWIGEDVSEVDFSEYERVTSLMSRNHYLGKDYSFASNQHGTVSYAVDKYPDDEDGKDCVTLIVIDDASVTLYGINCNSTFAQFDKAMKANGYEVEISTPQQNQTAHIARLGKVYVTLSVTANTDNPFQTHYSYMLLIGLQ